MPSGLAANELMFDHAGRRQPSARVAVMGQVSSGAHFRLHVAKTSHQYVPKR
jgi:hypothetical protein